MSGGSWEYFYYQLEEIADRLLEEGGCPHRIAFGNHLELCVKALHDIEWVDSGDKGSGDEIKAIRDVLGDTVDYMVLEVLQESAKVILTQTCEALQNISNIKTRMENKEVNHG